ncbi:MAG: peptidase M15 [Muribaculaceae bacterium]|nr:peptidase M15 [Muribaculaceae bacterium]
MNSKENNDTQDSLYITENFKWNELIFSSTASRYGIKNIPNENQSANLRRLCIEILQPIRTKYGEPIRITSGFRCKALNSAVGGVSNSQHLNGEAADIVCGDNKRLWNLIVSMIKENQISVGQLINEKNLTWIHISLPDARHCNQIIN